MINLSDMSETDTHTPLSPREIKPSRSLGSSMPEEPDVIEEEDVFAPIREHLQPLYTSGELLGFAVCDEEGEVLGNETFLSHEGVHKAAQIFLSSCQQMAESERGVYRLTVEMDDVIVIYHCIEQGQGLFILSSDCSLDAAAKKIAELAG